MNRTYFALVFTAFIVSACVGGTLSKQADQEVYPLRPANKSEAKELKHCLRSLHAAQEKQFNATNSYWPTIKSMNPPTTCGDYRLRLRNRDGGWEIEAKKSESDSSVQWTINQDAVIEEYLEPEEEELEF